MLVSEDGVFVGAVVSVDEALDDVFVLVVAVLGSGVVLVGVGVLVDGSDGLVLLAEAASVDVVLDTLMGVSFAGLLSVEVGADSSTVIPGAGGKSGVESGTTIPASPGTEVGASCSADATVASCARVR